MAEKEELPLDVVEQILMPQDVKDLLRWKSVCKSWQSLISTPRFVKSHLNHSYMNDRDCVEFGHRRIRDSFHVAAILIVGSCNGLVCVSTSPGGSVQFVVTNPSTREVKKLPRPVPPQDMPQNLFDRQAAYKCWGFGYDSATDDYKVFIGSRTLFRVFALTSNTWKEVNGEAVNPKRFSARKGILCDGALHWFMLNKVISFDLSTEEFKEIPLPLDEYQYGDRLGIIEECLCIYRDWEPLQGMKWVMRNNKWEAYNHNRSESSSKCDVVHKIRMSPPVDYTTSQTTNYVYGHEDGRLFNPCLDASIFVKSLVSPHPHPGVNNGNYNYAMQQRGRKDNMRKKKRSGKA